MLKHKIERRSNKMANIAIQHYNITKNMADKYMTNTEEYLDENCPITFIDDVQSRIAEGYRIIGRIEVMIDALDENSDHRENWKVLKSKVEEKVDELQDELK